MLYFSTRDPRKERGVTSAAAIKQGLAPDGGLYLPERIPSVGLDFINKISKADYVGRAVEILSLFLDDYSREELEECCRSAYSVSSFPDGAAPLKKINNGRYCLELWHGPTCAFKDMALQLMPRLLSLALGKTGETKDSLILVATSGDTGKAALEGYKDVDRIKILVFYPAEGVSRVQKLQMITQTGKNVCVKGISGNFDDAQNGVKAIFRDRSFASSLSDSGYILSSANSINWGRLVPQIVYYFSAYCDLIASGEIMAGDVIDFCVPTGNFGNILAGFIASKMGLPVGRFVCASNSNKVLTDFFETGVYDKNRKFITTTSPSMDILISSNLERLLCLEAGSDAAAFFMSELAAKGRYTVPVDIMIRIRESFTGLWASETEVSETIGRYYRGYGYLSDTHTAVALSCADRYLSESKAGRKCVTLSTASPYKFAASVYSAVTALDAPEGYAALSALADATGTPIPGPLTDIDRREIRFPDVISPSEMASAVAGFAGAGI